ncbi:MAG: ComEC family competence protein [Aquisalinus sp.]|nr:ComEC family competence protein [Aquisalinus sp.]
MAFYFGLKEEPYILIGPSVLVVSSICTRLPLGKLTALRHMAIALSLISLGFSAATLRTAMVATTFLSDYLRSYVVQGQILLIEDRLDSVRYTISVSRMTNMSGTDFPDKVRLSWRGEKPDLVAGDRVRVQAMLSAPPEPVRPEGYDYARQLYFEGIGGVGYAAAPPLKLTTDTTHRHFSILVESIRDRIAARISRSLVSVSPEARAVCIALVTGKRDGIDENTERILRDAGLAHLLAISGLHLGLVAGILFAATRWLLVWSEHIALHYPVKKIAALVALVGAFIYLFISGAAWSTQRAFIMTAVVFIAILMDRRGISLRNVAIAALLILIMRPEALLQAGFQMSFAAVTVLISVYEWHSRAQRTWRQKMQTDYLQTWWVKKGLVYFGGLTATSVLAGLATAPFGVFHFNRYAAYGLAGNLLAMPVMAAFIMPFAIIATLLIPVGLDGLMWRAMAFSVEIVLFVAGSVSSLPGSVTDVAQVSPIAFYSIIAGGLILCLLRSPMRLAGAFLIMTGTVLALGPVQPDILVSRNGNNIAVRLPVNGRDSLVPLSVSREKFTLENWLRANGEGEDLAGTRTLQSVLREQPLLGECGRSVCLINFSRTYRILIDTRQNISSLDCSEVTLFILPNTKYRGRTEICDAIIIDRAYIERSGALSIKLKKRFPKILTNQTFRGERPWVHSP